MFIGRTQELTRLNEMYTSGKFEFPVIYGRRRVGKTALIREFVKGKSVVFFSAGETTEHANLASLSECISGDGGIYPDFRKALAAVFKRAEAERLVFVIDEYPYLVESYRGISSELQILIDNNRDSTKLFLILCGSSMSFMENQVLGSQSPLYGRRTAQFKVEPFTFSGSLPFLPGFEPRDKAVVYGMTGGIPEYLGRIDNNKPVKQNMIELFLTTSGHSYEEPSNLLKQELREPATYNSLLEAIANGASKLNEISAKTNIESNKCAKYLASLMSLGIVRREYPITETSGKRSTYLLNDQMFRFWFRFVFPNISAIAMGLGDKVYESEVEPYLSDFMGHTFEQMREDKFPFFTGKVGRWWGNNPKLRKQEEIDILAFREDKAVFCECKWTNAPVGTDVLNELIRRRELFPYTEVWYYVFAKAGFTGGLAAEAEYMGNVRLVQYEEIVGNRRAVRGVKNPLVWLTEVLYGL